MLSYWHFLIKKLFPQSGTAMPVSAPHSNKPVAGLSNTAHVLCYAPSVNMLFATDGTVRACCHNHENSIGIYLEQEVR